MDVHRTITIIIATASYENSIEKAVATIPKETYLFNTASAHYTTLYRNRARLSVCRRIPLLMGHPICRTIDI